jgi:hypothetical protein
MGVVPHGGGRTLEAVPADDEVAGLLELALGAPVAFIGSVAWDEDTRPFDCYRAWLRTDRTKIDIQAAGPGRDATARRAEGEQGMRLLEGRRAVATGAGNA